MKQMMTTGPCLEKPTDAWAPASIHRAEMK